MGAGRNGGCVPARRVLTDGWLVYHRPRPARPSTETPRGLWVSARAVLATALLRRPSATVPVHSPTLVILAAIQPAPGTGDNQRGIPLTVSIGVALHAAGDTAGAVLQRADEAMYLAKQRGRNRVEVWAGAGDAPGAVGRAAAQAA